MNFTGSEGDIASKYDLNSTTSRLEETKMLETWKEHVLSKIIQISVPFSEIQVIEAR